MSQAQYEYSQAELARDRKDRYATADDSRNSEALYLDAPSWTPDSTRSLFRRGASD